MKYARNPDSWNIENSQACVNCVSWSKNSQECVRDQGVRMIQNRVKSPLTLVIPRESKTSDSMGVEEGESGSRYLLFRPLSACRESIFQVYLTPGMGAPI